MNNSLSHLDRASEHQIRRFVLKTLNVCVGRCLDLPNLLDLTCKADFSGQTSSGQVMQVIDGMVERNEVARVGENVQLPW